ncbi:D-glycero-beta-D-manno-heptose 1-phosphate adenylyltransferase [Brevibacterium samyangense]|uniref:D-glycero-beta-D-manno-heptose 1-phosphate adenylyltransferase n=1 Tax=Brevibacterium samyangense TaxID=366888 RepID=A0ABP5EJ22_9MICO
MTDGLSHTAFSRHRGLVVVGDVLLDTDVVGHAERLSPDGPVPVVDVDRARHRPGGAGLAALLLAADGVPVTLVTALGDDAAAAHVRSGLVGVHVVNGLLPSGTPVKKRVLADGRVVTRLDENCGPDPAPGVTEEMCAAVRAAHAVLVSDYGRGLLADPRLREALEDAATRVPVVWDPHPRGAPPVPGVRALTPNLPEALGLAGHGSAPASPAAGTRAASALAAELPVDAVVVTLGEAGAVLAENGTAGRFVPGVPASGDTCGAGDRFAGSLLVALDRGEALTDAVGTANRLASAFIARGGVGTVLAEQESGAAHLTGTPGTGPSRGHGDDGRNDDGAVPGTDDRATVLASLAEVRSRGGRIVATGGCFDLLHAGHARTLEAARRLGDVLVVCLNSDASVHRLKGDGRPIVREDDRAELLRALRYVDHVLIFDEDTPEAVLAQIRPDIWVKGGDYTPELLPETDLVRSWGGEVLAVPYHPARSTSLLAEALQTV